MCSFNVNNNNFCNSNSLNCFNLSGSKSNPSNDDVIKFLDMTYDDIEKNGLPKEIRLYLKTQLEAVLSITNNSLELAEIQSVLTCIDQLDGVKGWKQFSKNYLSNFAILLKSITPIIQSNLLVLDSSGGLDIFIFGGINEKLITLCAEGIARKNQIQLLDKGAWSIVKDSVFGIENTVLIYRCFEENAWGFASLSPTAGDRAPTMFTRIPYATTILRDAINSIEKDTFDIFCSNIKSRVPLESFFLPDALLKKQEVNREIFVTFGYSPDSYSPMNLSNSPILTASAIFYAGPVDFSKNTPNGKQIDFCIDPFNGEVDLSSYEKETFFQTIKENSPAQQAYQLCLEAVSVLKKDASNFLAINLEEFEISYCISFPQTAKEWNDQEISLLSELRDDLTKDKPGAARTILAIASALEIEIPVEDLSQEEKEQLDSVGSVDISATTALKSMRTNAFKTYVQLAKDKETMNPMPSSLGKQEIKSSKEEKNVKQTSSNSKKLKKNKKSNSKNNNNNNNNSQTATAQKKTIIFSKEEKEISGAVMKGNAQKSSDFNKVARGMLEKILGEEASTIKEIKDGSHLVLHFEQNGIGKGLTLVKKHGNKDAMTMVFKQKRTLKDLFELKDNAKNNS